MWQKTYQVSGANNIRLHFSAFDVEAGVTETARDYVKLERGGSGTTIDTFTGNLGAFWGPWAAKNDANPENTILLKLYSDNAASANTGLVVDQLEYTTADNGRFVMHLRMPGQLWDDDARASANWHRWYRREDGRYLSPCGYDTPVPTVLPAPMP